MQATVQTETGLLPIPSVISQEMDNIAVLYGDSDDDSWKAVALKVNQINRRIDYINNLPDLDPGGTLDFGFFGEDGHSDAVSSPGQDQLRIESDVSQTLMEYGIGIEPDGVQVAVENPSGELVTGVQDADRLRGYQPEAANSSDFNDFGSVLSDHTMLPSGIPTTALSETPQQGLVRFDQSSDVHNNIYFGFRNTRENTVSLSATAWGATYRVTPVQDQQTAKDVVFGSNGIRRRVLTYGGLTNTAPNRPTEWKRGEVTLTGSDAINAVSGGGA